MGMRLVQYLRRGLSALQNCHDNEVAPRDRWDRPDHRNKRAAKPRGRDARNTTALVVSGAAVPPLTVTNRIAGSSIYFLFLPASSSRSSAVKAASSRAFQRSPTDLA
jgi:hypothetical protein